MSTRILHPYTNVRPLSQINTLHGMIRVAKDYPAETMTVYCQTDRSYWLAISDGWGTHDLINVEQDIEVSSSLVRELLECPSPLCAYPYRLDAGEWSVWNTSFVGDIPGITGYYKELPEYARGAGFGFVKISQAVQQSIDISAYPVEKYQWWFLDTWFSYAMLRTASHQFHLHHPIEHYRNIAS